MVSEIKVQRGKFLSLKNVIFVEANDIQKTNVVIASSISKLKAYGVSVHGPLTVWANMETFEGKIRVERKLIMQCVEDLSEISVSFEKKENVKIGPCIYARFVGKEEDLIRAFEKASVYAYENDIKLKNENYTVYVEQKGLISTIDVFVLVECDK